jgi:RNA polymerase sigma-70 factor (ECF subfamily)
MGVETMLTGERAAAAETPGTSPDAFRHFVEPHWPMMERLARRLAPEGQWDEVLQEALITAWRKRRQYDPKRGTARTWLLAVVADKAQKAFRSAYRRGRLAAPGAETDRARDVVAMPAEPGARLDVRAAISTLPPRQRTAITLHYYLGLSTAEAAEVMSCSVGTVKSTLSDARRQLKTILGEDYHHA